MWFYFIRDLRCEASKLIRNLVAHIFNQKVLNFCENSYMEKQSNFWYVTLTARSCDPTRKCNVCVASASSSSNLEPVLRHRATDAQRRTRLDEELAILHRELGEDPEPHERQPARMVLVQEQPREGNDERQEHRPAAEQPRARGPTPPAQGCTRDNDRCANEGANISANANIDACNTRKFHHNKNIVSNMV
jgi:hypothetical protein